MKKILFMPPEPWYVEAHIEYLIRYFGGKYIMDQGYIGNEEARKANPLLKNPDDYDLLIPLLASAPIVDQIKYAHKFAGILWEPCEGTWREMLIVAATTPIVEKSMQDTNHPYIAVAPGIDTELFQPFPQAREDNLLHIGVIGKAHNPRHNIKNIILKLLDIKGVKFDFYVRDFFPDRLNDIETAGGQKFLDNIVDGDKKWVGLPNLYNRMDVLLKLDSDPGLTFPILEAGACGVPFIATNVGIESTLPGIVIYPNETDSNGNGRGWYLEHFEDIVNIARQEIIYLRDNPEIRKKMGRAIRKEVLKNWTWKTKIPKWGKFFEQALKMAK